MGECITVADLIGELAEEQPELRVKIMLVDRRAEPYCDAILQRGSYSLTHQIEKGGVDGAEADMLLLTCVALE